MEAEVFVISCFFAANGTLMPRLLDAMIIKGETQDGTYCTCSWDARD